MRICDNGVYRDATLEEIEIFNNTPAPGDVMDADAEAADYEAALNRLGVLV